LSNIKEDAPVNCASSGEVAGLDNNPPVSKKRKPKLLRRILVKQPNV